MPALTRTSSISSQASDQSSGGGGGGGGGTTTGQRALSGMKRFLGRRDKDKNQQARTTTARQAADGDEDDDEELLSPGLLDTAKPKAGRMLAARPASTTSMAVSPADRSNATLMQLKQPLGQAASVNTPVDATGKPTSSLRKQTSYSSISNASTTTSVASTRTGLPTIGGLPRPRTTSTASFTAPSSISSISTSQSRRISATHRELPTLAHRSRTTSVTSPANTSFNASPNKRGSRVPVSSISARRLGSVQSIRGLEATPRPVAISAKAQHGRELSNEDSPGLEVLVANTTLSMQDLQETLSPLTSAISRQDRKDRRAEGSWISVDHDDIENINTPSKANQTAELSKSPRQAVKTSTASIGGASARTSNSILPKSLTNDGLPLPPSRAIQRKNPHPPVPLQPKVASQIISNSSSNSQQRLRARTEAKVSSEISDILDAANASSAHESPARDLAAESSTYAMHHDLSGVALTPIKPNLQASRGSSDLEAIRKEMLEEAAKEKLLYEAEMQTTIRGLQLAKEKQAQELSDLRAMLAKGAGTANRLAQLEAEHTSSRRQGEASQRLKEQVQAQTQNIAIQKQVFAQALAAAQWKELQRDYAAERRELELQKETLNLLKDLVYVAESEIRCGALGR